MSKNGKTKFEIAIADRVRAIRLEKGFSQEYLAEALGVSKGFIGQIETPRHASKYSFTHLNKLAKEMNCSPKDFMPDKYIEEDNWIEE